MQKLNLIMIVQLLNLMQAVFYDKQKFRFSSSEQRDQSRTQSKIITRKQAKRTNNVFKKKKQDDDHIPQRDKRYHSSHLFKFVKQSSAQDRDTPISKNQKEESNTIEQQKEHKKSSRNSPSKQSPKKSLVFNKFTQREKQQIRDLLILIKATIDKSFTDNNLKDFYIQIQAYITKIEQNNSKLLEVNYFFQKEFNEIMTERQASKRIQKCSKNHCMQCRYHLQKQNHWKQQKIQLTNRISRLQQELTSIQTSKSDIISQQPSIMLEQSGTDSSNERSSLLRLRQQLQQKDEEYLILLKEFNYLDEINKDLKSKIGKVMQEYKYLSIENRTLLNIKTKLIEKEVECTKYKDERDYFKRKVIDNHKRKEEEKNKAFGSNCKCKNKEDQSIFSLSSASNDFSHANQGSTFSNNSSNHINQ